MTVILCIRLTCVDVYLYDNSNKGNFTNDFRYSERKFVYSLGRRRFSGEWVFMPGRDFISASHQPLFNFGEE